ncbi:MAG: hypothetical protein CMA03_01790 [Euryarchaeota archaeon]|nr:hypothetical protein [Euryarchaeota archaeon]
MQIHILGTSSSKPAHGRSVSGSVINTEKGAIIVDCGEGFQERIYTHNKDLKEKKSLFRVKTGKICTILLTHGHLDHTWGLLPFLKTLSLEGRDKPLTIIAPTTHEIINRLFETKNPFAEISDLEPSNVDLCFQFRFWWSLGGTREFLDFETNWILVGTNENDEIGKTNAILIDPLGKSVEKIDDFKDYTNGIEILNIPTLHTVPSCAWWIKEDDKKGKFNSELAEKNNLTKEEIQLLAKGESVGNHSHLDYRSSEQTGPSVLISGDTSGENNGFINFSKTEKETSLLIHEATFMEENLDKAEKYLHSTAIQAANHAKLIKAKHLIITHYSSRIKDTKYLKDEAQKEFDSVHAASDKDVINLTSNSIEINS